MLPGLDEFARSIEGIECMCAFGRVTEITGLLLKVSGLRVSVGEACMIHSDDQEPVPAEVVGFKDGQSLIMAIGEQAGIRPGSRVQAIGRKLSITVGPAMVGRVLDYLGNPMDGKGPIIGEQYPLFTQSPHPLKRRRIHDPMDLGVRAINGLLTVGKGQRLGIMAGSGVGKSVLLGMMSKFTAADVNVIGLIGERAREVREFIERDLGPEGLKRSVVIVSTSEQPPLAKVRSAFTATAVAEYFRAQQKDVLLLMDSLTRVAMAQREIGLAIGEPPTAKGYTPSVFAMIPKILERAGTSDSKGSITGLYTVLVEGDDFNEPIADASRSVLDGHFVLTRELAIENHFPAIDVLQSKSRVMSDIVDPKHMQFAGRFLETLANYRRAEDLINLGAYKKGSNPKIDFSIEMIEPMRNFLRQGMNDRKDFADSLQGLYMMFDKAQQQHPPQQQAR